jgi:hypothetical protein
LDVDAYRAYRAAMRRSRGGVVRTSDLLAGLAECLPRATASVLAIGADAVATLARPPASDPDLVPMANTPDLRAALTVAYRRAEGGSITPEHLLATLAEDRSISRPAASRNARVNPLPAPSSPRAAVPTPADWTGDDAAAVLARWLSAQGLPPALREAEIEWIARNPGGPGRSLA